MATAVKSAWIAPTGEFHAVEFAGHWQFATNQWKLIDATADYTRHGDPVGDLERAGWIHISNSEYKRAESGISIVAPRRVAKAQIETMFDWAAAHSAAGNEEWAAGVMQWIFENDK